MSKRSKIACEKPYSRRRVWKSAKLFMELMSGTQARAQQYFFFAERKAAKIEGLPEDSAPRDIKRVGVIGAGTMGGGISMNFCLCGYPRHHRSRWARRRWTAGLGLMRKNYEARRTRDEMTSDQVDSHGPAQV